MGVSVSIEDTLAELKVKLEKKLPKELLKAARSSLARTLPSLVRDVASEVGKGLAISEAKLRNKYIERRKFLTGGFANMRVEAIARERGILMTEFVRGSKTPMSQAGKAVRKRKTISVTVRPGMTTALKASSRVSGAFLIRGKGGTVLLMRRYKDRNRAGKRGNVPGVPLHRPMRASSPAARLGNEASASIIRRATDKYRAEFAHAMRWLISGKQG